MVSGVLRIVELALLVLSGATLFVYYVGLGTELDWHYPVVIAGASLLAVMLLEITDCYQLAALTRPRLQRWHASRSRGPERSSLFAVVGIFLISPARFRAFWFGGWYAGGARRFCIGPRLVLALMVVRGGRATAGSTGGP